jgi:polysaccharide export outer membrane protein
VAWVLLVVLLAQPVLVAAQDGAAEDARLRPGDILELTVPGREDLSMEMTIDPEGAVDVPRVGEVVVAGLTADQASLTLKNKLRLFYPTLDTVDLEVTRSGALKVYVIGKVSRPGLMTFSGTPSLWEVLRAAGGVDDQGDLRGARVIREENGVPRVTMVDLSGILDGKAFPDFVLKDGDTLIIPALLEGIPTVPSADGVKVFGGVAVATIVPITEPMPMLDVLMLAGAPAENAQKKEIYWVHEDGGRAQSTLVNLELFLKEGNPAGNPLVYPGDTLHVTYRKTPWTQSVTFVLVSLASLVTILIGYDRLVND